MLMKRIVQANIKKQSHETSVKNVIFMSVKTISSDIITIVKRKGNWLFDILHVLKSVAFTWCLEWVIAAQRILW